ncbi:alpha/beta hydrolase fold domain-containing protein [Ditylenchus destructor]|nr:alpha/beta hydrolase fold domain-containing protein [Ditylenchus destructor]
MGEPTLLWCDPSPPDRRPIPVRRTRTASAVPHRSREIPMSDPTSKLPSANADLMPGRRQFLASSALAGATGLGLLQFAGEASAAGASAGSISAGGKSVYTGPSDAATAAPGDDSIREFRIAIPDAALADLRSRLAKTRWPDRETVRDTSQGVQLARLQSLCGYWGTSYDWRQVEARLNALPQFMTQIDGVDIHFIHVRSRHANALPLILTHGWPGSVLEMVKAIGPLTDPTAHGGRAEDAFDVVIPSIPGYGFSGRPTELGWGPERTAKAWDALMKRLGYTRYVSQGGDHGSVVSDALARQKPAGLLGIHVNMPPTVPPELVKGINSGDTPPAGLAPDERLAFETWPSSSAAMPPTAR